MCKPSAPKKRKAIDSIDLPSLKHHFLVVKATSKPPKSPSRSKPKWKVKCVPQCVSLNNMTLKDMVIVKNLRMRAPKTTLNCIHQEKPLMRLSLRFHHLFLKSWNALVLLQLPMKRLSMWSDIQTFQACYST